MTKGLTGIPSLAYVGVNAGSPPNIKMYTRSPNPDDSKNFIIGDLWLNTTPTPAALRELWILVALLGDYATWVKILPSTGGGGNLRSDDLLIESPDPATGAINVYGGEPYGGDAEYINMYTNRLDDHTLYVNLKRSINQPFTNVTGSEGVYSLGKVNFLHAYGTNNTFLGLNGVSIPTINPALATNNTSCGAGALHNLNESSNCVAIGYNAADKTSDGVHIIAIGANSGSALDPSDSSCILIGHPGKNTESNATHIGVSGAGDGEVNKCYIGGIWNVLPVPGRDTGLVIIDDEDKLCTYNTEINSILGTDANGNPIAIKGAVGTVLTGHGLLPADPTPEFLPITSSGGTVTISTDPITGSINLEAAGVAGLVQLTTDAGVALPLAGNINVLGGELIKTDAAVANTVTVNLKRGADGQIIVGNTAAASTYRDLICSDGSLSVDFSNPAQVDLKVVGIPPVGGINYLMDHALLHVPPIANGIQIEQGANITTVGDALNAKITVSVTDSVELPSGHLLTRDYIETTAGDMIIDAGNLRLPATNNTGTEGVIRFNNTAVLHCYGAASTSNIFVGPVCGNYTTLDTASSTFNSGLGRDSLKSLTTSAYNTACGAKIFDALTSGYGNNTGLGYAAGSKLVTGAYNTFLGEFAGYNCTGSDSHNVHIRNAGVAGDNRTIRIGTDGAVDGGQTSCYIAAIYNKVPGPSAEMVTIGSDGKLGTTGIPSGGAATFVTDSGTATVSGTTIQIKGGYNVNTSGATNIVTVNLDDSVLQPITNATGTQGVYAMGTKGATTYETNRFMHAWGGGVGMTGYNTFLGYKNGRIDPAAIGLNNTIVGALAFDAYTSASNCVAIGKNSMTNATTSSSTTCVGSGSGSALTTGGSNLLLGLNSGNAYTTESNNITLAHGGVAGDSRTMRLGYDTQWNWVIDKSHPNGYGAMTTTGTTSAYLYGAFNSDVDETAAPVYVDKTGKLGTNGGVSYAYHQAASIVDVTGDGTLYVFGTASPLVKDFDATGVVTVGGGGAPAFFKAPFPGKYFFSATITYDIPALPVPPPAPVIVSPLYLLAKKVGATATTSYMFATFIPKPLVGVAQQASEIVTAEIFLDKDETVRWACRVENMTKRIGIKHANVVTYGGLAYTCWATYFTGHRVG